MFSSPRFNGYAACPIKTTYLQPNSQMGNAQVMKELQAIGKREGFTVLAQLNDQLLTEPAQFPRNWEKTKTTKKSYPAIDTANKYRWSQDGRTIIWRKGQEVLLNAKAAYADYKALAQNLAQNLGLPFIESELKLEGGNFFIGKKADGTRYLLVGSDVLQKTASWYDTLLKRSETESAKVLRVQQELSELLDIEPANIHFISQPDFHLDMAMRPLSGNTVLLEDPDLSRDLIRKAIQRTQQPLEKKMLKELLKGTDFTLASPRATYATTDTVESELTQAGFQVIRVPGKFGREWSDNKKDREGVDGGIGNFLNALVQQRPNGDLAYITNAYHLPVLNQLFQETLQAAVPQIKACYFVTGGTSKRNGWFNYMQDCLNMNGGLHCMLTEHPDFERWV